MLLRLLLGSLHRLAHFFGDEILEKLVPRHFLLVFVLVADQEEIVLVTHDTTGEDPLAGPLLPHLEQQRARPREVRWAR